MTSLYIAYAVCAAVVLVTLIICASILIDDAAERKARRR